MSLTFVHNFQTSEGQVVYEGVRFRYPMRPSVEVLQGLDLKVLKGQTVALVGYSGCGKSTLIQLLLRYYDLDEGKIVRNLKLVIDCIVKANFSVDI